MGHAAARDCLGLNHEATAKQLWDFEQVIQSLYLVCQYFSLEKADKESLIGLSNMLNALNQAELTETYLAYS